MINSLLITLLATNAAVHQKSTADHSTVAAPIHDAKADEESSLPTPDLRVICAAALASTAHSAALAFFPAPLVLGFIANTEARRRGVRWTPPPQLSPFFLSVGAITFYLACAIYSPGVLVAAGAGGVGLAGVSVDRSWARRVVTSLLFASAYLIGFGLAAVPVIIGSWYLGGVLVTAAHLPTVGYPGERHLFWIWAGGAIVHMVALPFLPTLATAVAVSGVYVHELFVLQE